MRLAKEALRRYNNGNIHTEDLSEDDMKQIKDVAGDTVRGGRRKYMEIKKTAKEAAAKKVLRVPPVIFHRKKKEGTFY